MNLFVDPPLQIEEPTGQYANFKGKIFDLRGCEFEFVAFVNDADAVGVLVIQNMERAVRKPLSPVFAFLYV